MATDKYLDDLLHDAWIPLPPVETDDAVVLQCHRDADRKRSYFRVTLIDSRIEGVDDPEDRRGMTILGVAVTNGLLCLEGVEGAELRLRRPGAIKHVAAGSVDDNRSWTTKIGLRDGDEPPLASEIVPIADDEPSSMIGGQDVADPSPDENDGSHSE